jgi:serine/threonine protein kinase
MQSNVDEQNTSDGKETHNTQPRKKTRLNPNNTQLCSFIKPISRGGGIAGEVHEVGYHIRKRITYRSASAFHDFHNEWVNEVFALTIMRDHHHVINISDIVHNHIDCVDLHLDVWHGNLRELIRSRESLSIPEMFNMMSQLITSLRDIHAQCIIHSDIKVDNILFKKEYTGLKLSFADFGKAMKCPPVPIRRDSYTVTDGYRAPEINEFSMNAEYAYPVDVWSLGIVFIKILDKHNILSNYYTETKRNAGTIAMVSRDDFWIELMKPFIHSTVTGRERNMVVSMFNTTKRMLHPDMNIRIKADGACRDFQQFHVYETILPKFIPIDSMHLAYRNDYFNTLISLCTSVNNAFNAFGFYLCGQALIYMDVYNSRTTQRHHVPHMALTLTALFLACKAYRMKAGSSVSLFISELCVQHNIDPKTYNLSAGTDLHTQIRSTAPLLLVSLGYHGFMPFRGQDDNKVSLSTGLYNEMYSFEAWISNNTQLSAFPTSLSQDIIFKLTSTREIIMTYIKQVLPMKPAHGLSSSS